MNVIKRLLESIVIASKKIQYEFSEKPQKSRVVYNIPYYSQWESNNLVNEILTEKLKAQNDPKWKNSGAKTHEEYAIWSWSGCGMACLKMILKDRLKKDYPLVELGKMCMKYGGYKDNSAKYDTNKTINQGKAVPSGYFEGLFYKQFLNFIRREFSLEGIIIRPMVIGDILKAISNHRYVIVSVNASIRDANSIPPYKGGHLVLVTGFDLRKKLLYIHNPSGFYQESQENYPICFNDFNKFFSNRGIVISQNKNF